jgi:hypothetical protein
MAPNAPKALPTRAALISENPNLVSNLKKHFHAGDFKTNACWPWTGAKKEHHGNHYYGEVGIQFGRKRRVVYPHRLMYLLQHGELPINREVAHQCQNTLCVNPTHLELFGREAHLAFDELAKEIKKMTGGKHNWIICHDMLLWEGFDLPNSMSMQQRR